jgi:hypothetical protein
MAESASIMELDAMVVDACKGYDEAIQATEKPRLKALFEKAKSVHEKAHAKFMRSCAQEPPIRITKLRSSRRCIKSLFQRGRQGWDLLRVSYLRLCPEMEGSLRPTIRRSTQTTMTGLSATFCSDKSLCSWSLRANCKGTPRFRIV